MSLSSAVSVRSTRLGAETTSVRWALADQGAVSLGNFTTQMVLARHLPLGEYGLFGLLLDVMLFLNSVQAALVIYPLSVKGAAADRAGLRQSASAALLLTGLLWLPLGAALLGVAGVLGGPPLGVWAVLAIVPWQLQETARRSLMAELRVRDALAGDAISYLGQAAAVAALAWTGHLSVALALAVMGCTSAAALIVQVLQIGFQPVPLSVVRQFAANCWRLGCWMAVGTLTMVVTSAVYSWALAFFHGLGPVGVGQAFSNLVKVTHPVNAGVLNLMLPALARAFSREGFQAGRRVARQHALHMALLLAPYLLVLIVWPRLVLSTAYGSDSRYLQFAPVLRVFAASYACLHASNFLIAWINSMGRSRAALLAQVASTLTTVAVGLPLTIRGGLAGAVWGGLLATACGAATSAYVLWRLSRTAEPHPNLGANKGVAMS